MSAKEQAEELRQQAIKLLLDEQELLREQLLQFDMTKRCPSRQTARQTAKGGNRIGRPSE